MVRTGRLHSIKYHDGFAQRMRELRLAAELTEAEMCEWLGGISRSTLGAWARGTRRPQWYTGARLDKLLDYLETEVGRTPARLPIPLGIRQNARINYIRNIRKSYPAK